MKNFKKLIATILTLVGFVGQADLHASWLHQLPPAAVCCLPAVYGGVCGSLWAYWKYTKAEQCTQNNQSDQTSNNHEQATDGAEASQQTFSADAGQPSRLNQCNECKKLIQNNPSKMQYITETASRFALYGMAWIVGMGIYFSVPFSK